jgi:hypothetical protein
MTSSPDSRPPGTLRSSRLEELVRRDLRLGRDFVEQNSARRVREIMTQARQEAAQTRPTVSETITGSLATTLDDATLTGVGAAEVAPVEKFLKEADVASVVASTVHEAFDAWEAKFLDALQPKLAKALSEETRKGRTVRWFVAFATGIAASIIAALVYSWALGLWKAWTHS